MGEIRRGRPRDDKARAAALDAARELLRTEGYEGLSLDQVAAKAGVGKQSLYRWWGSKAELITQAVLDGYITTVPLTVPMTSDARRDVRSLVDILITGMSSPENSPLIRALVVVAATDAATADVLWDRFTGPFRLAIVERLAAAVDEGQLRRGFSADVAAQAIIGAVLFLVLGRQEVPGSYADDLIELLLHGIDVG